MSGSLRFELLGPQRAWYADRELDLGPGKRRAVLAVLLLSAGRPVPTAHIVDAVWPDDPPANGPNVVQKHVAGLRRILEPERSPRTPGQVLALTDAGYLLHVDPEAVDAIRFERGVRRAERHREEGRPAEALAELAAALDLWRGEPFTGFGGPFFDSVRQRYVDLRATALENRVEVELDQGRHRELVGPLVELAVEFPVRERLRRHLMVALYRSGRQAEALAAYRDLDELLRDEYGIEPGEELRELHRRILCADPELLRAAPPPPPAAPAPAATSEPARPMPTASAPAATDLPAPVGYAVPAPVPAPHTWPPVPAQVAPPAVPWPAVAATVHQIAVGPASHPVTTAPLRRAPRWLGVVATVVGTLTVLLSFGGLTWLVMLGYAAWRRSWLLALAGAGYLAVLVGLVVVGAQVDPDPDVELPDSQFLFLVGAVGVCWLVGALHVILLDRGVRALLGGGRPAGDGHQPGGVPGRW
ncbi:AfsR/SARP family transcriptional regulator [Micromonospora thermarum]|uniref:AfsR/SARP family transcriptional regulator n=1 Tax=Micromonospora thermarum TaxID=2720024 RepID=A0ABX0Z0S0_9ACTN|nr:AfsR/SARP family transcriptional regulator [Micromonospora thermarum]NJP31361.1 AfsR/SARP family transcriptional regulator [Micromonospora thermarum]